MNSHFYCFVFAALLAFSFSEAAHAANVDEAKPSTKLQTYSQTKLPSLTVSELADLESSFAKTPNNIDVVSQLALAYISRAQRTGQRDYISYARLILQPWINARDVPESVLLPRAYLYIDSHNTDAALADLRGLEKSRPLDAQLKLASALIYQDKQDFQQAIARCYQVSRLSRAEIASACLASVFLAMDQPGRAKPLLQAIEPVVLAYSAGAGEEQGEEFGLATEIWVLRLLTKLAIQQQENFAESYYRAALVDRGAVYEELSGEAAGS